MVPDTTIVPLLLVLRPDRPSWPRLPAVATCQVGFLVGIGTSLIGG